MVKYTLSKHKDVKLSIYRFHLVLIVSINNWILLFEALVIQGSSTNSLFFYEARQLLSRVYIIRVSNIGLNRDFNASHEVILNFFY